MKAKIKQLIRLNNKIFIIVFPVWFAISILNIVVPSVFDSNKLVNFLYQQWLLLDEEQQLKIIVGLFQPSATIFTGIALFGNFWVAQKNTQIAQKKLETERLNNENRLITENFSKAVEQLASEKIEVRLGGIYSLERIAQDSHRDRLTVMKVLASFINNKSSLKEMTNVSTDIQAALNAIAKPDSNDSDSEKKYIAEIHNIFEGRAGDSNIEETNLDLTNANLKGANLKSFNLRGFNLENANLEDANLINANLINANLKSANLTRAILIKADLRGANLIDANLSDTNLRQANLKKCENLKNINWKNSKLYDADLSGAHLNHSNLEGIELDGSNLKNTIFSRANLRNASLNYTDLTNADFYQANLENASLEREVNLKNSYLTEANLKNANLEGVSNLNSKQVKSARYWQQAKYSKSLRYELDLPDESNKNEEDS